ncbi:hypothetical protein Mal52_30670 [Symmachiella dynata]|uniref:Uncharacterized protein n=1 Tax=Symmachiella dynata TaxID=2527995 RepID=A0A517ZQ23_9PLAN|nr:hypothetical protein [Symmachiella dynata]QDU44582.1 hypothetical protein Mal52_30670 [Symmachiella dynata]
MCETLRMLEVLGPQLPRGSSTVPIVELEKSAVSTPNRRIVRSPQKWPNDDSALATTCLGHAKTELPIEAWQFYHAAAKTELAGSFDEDAVKMGALGIAFQTASLLRWSGETLRLRRSGIFSRKDSSRTALAGRFGEAATYLFMLQQGYIYWDHIPSLLERAMNDVRISHNEQVQFAQLIKKRFKRKTPEKEPDFAFETGQGVVALAEAKGAFVPPDSSPKMVKQNLAEGLEQVDAWANLISPQPKKLFAVGLYLREEADPYPDSSLLAFVDPETDATADETVPFRNDWIRRGNYGAWLIGMGLVGAGMALRSAQTTDTSARHLVVISFGEESFAIVTKSEMKALGLALIEWNVFLALIRSYPGVNVDVPIMGIDVSILRSVEDIIVDADADFQPDRKSMLRESSEWPAWFSGSILPDGTLFGALHFGRSDKPQLSVAEFRL